MNYVFINPVTDAMYGAEFLERYLTQRNCKRVYCKEDWGNIVLNKYKKAIENTEECVLDMRCPAAVQVVRKYDRAGLMFPDIHPILIHCGIELSRREDLKDSLKIITTPCDSLAEYGNSLGLNNTEFIAWKKWFNTGNNKIKPKLINESPIPPGYFANLKYKVKSLTGENQIKSYSEKQSFDDYRLIEMLLCPDGCHNGDGVC